MKKLRKRQLLGIKLIKMNYKFHAYGHPNIKATHKTTFEFTKDKEISLKGDCIVGVNADFDLEKIKKFIKNIKNNRITITIKTILKSNHIKETIFAEINKNFNNNHEFVIRKTDFVSGRTFAIKANKAAFELSRKLVECLKKQDCKINISLHNY